MARERVDGAKALTVPGNLHERLHIEAHAVYDAHMEIDEGGFFSRGKVRLPPSPDLTVDAVYGEVVDNFASSRQYEVYKTALIGADLVIKRSAWTGLAIKVKHTASETLIMFNPLAPSVMVRLLFMGLLPMLILYFGAWSEIRQEFIAYAKTAARFQR